MEALGPLLGDLGTSWGGLGSLLEALGPLLGDLGSFLGDLEAVLGRSWGLLAPSWVVLEGQEGQKGSGPGGLADQEREMLGTPRRIRLSWPPPILSQRGLGDEENRTQDHREEGRVRTTGKREESEPQGRWKSRRQGCPARPEAQGAGGFISVTLVYKRFRLGVDFS